ncbi:DUF5666 domain-containing protein [Candidatus Magnetobacterium casense]|uniref:DUF5666 domain-containing protein n=1 Tax=Candidatus Magnetobacterium casense TaxID=1455061 RepID=A0ABS6RZ22_9BACT|nr:DUF5666 domain-containing protein [Candidatus Magnetobacterium casensis]MBV6341897.1 hypothetical protein [Candidatus Magnetobacterium casensis]
MRRLQTVFLALAVVIVMVASNAYTSGREDEHKDEYYKDQGRHGKIYGVIKEMPKESVGTWTVGKRKVVVTENTHIKEKHGKAIVGAYVEVEGGYDGDTFVADEIEVKRARNRS